MKTLFNKLNIAIILSVMCCIISLYILLFSNNGKFAYVRSADLINQYDGMKEARELYQIKANTWDSNMDTLESNFQRKLNEYKMKAKDMGAKEREIEENNLAVQQSSLKEYESQIVKKAKEEDEKISSGVLNQINSYVESYGKKNGYDLIFGTSTSGNILYGNKFMDITDDVLQGLNKSYNSGELKKSANEGE